MIAGIYYSGADYVSASEGGKAVRYPTSNAIYLFIQERAKQLGIDEIAEALGIDELLETFINVELAEIETIVKFGTNDPVIINIASGEDWLYGLLGMNPACQQEIEIMKYLLKIYRSGEPINKFDGIKIMASVYEPTEFVEGSYNSYTGGINVHDESLFITDIETLKKALSGYSKGDKLVEHAQEFLDMQKKYKVNAIFAAAVSIEETGGGNKGNAIASTDGINPSNGKKWEAVGSYSGEKWNNWFNQKTTSDSHYGIIRNKEGESHYRIFDSVALSIDGFGDNIANGNYYYTKGKYTVSEIGHTYCPNSDAYPTQGDDWVARVTSQMMAFYDAAGMDISAEVFPENNSGGVVRYYQNDYASVPYGNTKTSVYGTLAGRGCGPTSFAMVATTITGRMITPKDAIAWCGDTYYVPGRGTSWSYFNAAAKHFGFSCRQVSSFSDVENALKQGKLVISSQDPGLFTKAGHYIVLTKMVNGKIYVNDPNKTNAINKGYNERAFTVSEVDSTAKQYWIFE